MNINAYLKYVVVKKKIKIKQLSNQISLDASYLSRVFNNIKNIADGRNLDKICLSLNINKAKLFSSNSTIENLYKKFLEATFFLNRDERNCIYEEIEKMKDELKDSPDYLYYLLVKFIQSSVTKKYEYALINLLSKIYRSFSINDQIIFLIFYYGYLRSIENFKEGNNVYNKLQQYNILEKNQVMMFNYYHFSYGIYHNDSLNYLKSLEICKKICLETNNNNRLLNLNILYSSHLKDLGYLNAALENELEIYFYMSSNNLTYCLDIVTNNIGNTYLLLNNYEKAIEYFKKSLSISENNSLHFYLAFCYYRLKNNDDAKNHIKKGKLSYNRHDYYLYLLRWLDAMIKNRYSKKCCEILLHIYQKYYEELITQQKNFIILEIINYYTFHKNYESAIKWAATLINKNVIAQTHITEYI